MEGFELLNQENSKRLLDLFERYVVSQEKLVELVGKQVSTGSKVAKAVVKGLTAAQVEAGERGDCDVCLQPRGNCESWCHRKLT